MLYVIRTFENGGVLVSDKKPQVLTTGLFAGLTKLDGKRFQIASLKRMVDQQLNNPELTQYADDYISSLKPGDELKWANATDEPVIVTIDDERVTLTRKWASIDLKKAFAAVEAFVEASEEVDA